MTVRVRVARPLAAAPADVWRVLTDWAGQGRWIPFTTVRVVSDHAVGLGVRCEALSGWWLGRIPMGLLDRFTVTTWRPPTDRSPGVLEVLHTGPWFRGPGTFELVPIAAGGATRVLCTEIVDVVGGTIPTRLAGLLRPVLGLGFLISLGALGRLSRADR